MVSSTCAEAQAVVDTIVHRDRDQVLFHEALSEVVESLLPLFSIESTGAEHLALFKRLAEPERVIHFRVPWVDDTGAVRINRGFRVQYSSAIGPYKGGLRFHPSVCLDTIKFLGFEQVLKNSLTGLPLGGAKGGADVDATNLTDGEMQRFCQSFMTELARHINANTDVPAGDIGVGAREIGYLFGQYKRIANQFTGILTGRGVDWGGSLIRPEAAGYGCVYFTQHAVQSASETIQGKRIMVSGSGNVSSYAALKAMHLGAIVLTLSDTSGTIYSPQGGGGLCHACVEFLLLAKGKDRRVRVSALLETSIGKKCGVRFAADTQPWDVEALTEVDIVLPCATQGEITAAGAATIIAKGGRFVIEGANMPTTAAAIAALKSAGVVYGPGKASNAGGVAVSGLEMAQASQRQYWTREAVDYKLSSIMKEIYESCVTAAAAYGLDGDLQAGANIAGFLKVAEAMKAQGVV